MSRFRRRVITDQVLTHTRVNKCRGVSSTSKYLSTRLREHLVSDRTCQIFRHLHNSPQCRTVCSDEYFNILDHASTTFNLKSKKLYKFNGGKPTLNHQLETFLVNAYIILLLFFLLSNQHFLTHFKFNFVLCII